MVGGRRGGGLIMLPTGNKTHREFTKKKKTEISQEEAAAVSSVSRTLKGCSAVFDIKVELL